MNVYPMIRSYHFCCRVAYAYANARVVRSTKKEKRSQLQQVLLHLLLLLEEWWPASSLPYLSCCASRKWMYFDTSCLRQNAVQFARLRYITSISVYTSVPVSIHQLHSSILHSSLQNYGVSSISSASNC